MFTEFIEKNVKKFIITDNSKTCSMEPQQRTQTSFFLNIKNNSSVKKEK